MINNIFAFRTLKYLLKINNRKMPNFRNKTKLNSHFMKEDTGSYGGSHQLSWRLRRQSCEFKANLSNIRSSH